MATHEIPSCSSPCPCPCPQLCAFVRVQFSGSGLCMSAALTGVRSTGHRAPFRQLGFKHPIPHSHQNYPKLSTRRCESYWPSVGKVQPTNRRGIFCRPTLSLVPARIFGNATCKQQPARERERQGAPPRDMTSLTFGAAGGAWSAFASAGVLTSTAPSTRAFRDGAATEPHAAADSACC